MYVYVHVCMNVYMYVSMYLYICMYNYACISEVISMYIETLYILSNLVIVICISNITTDNALTHNKPQVPTIPRSRQHTN